jgi:integrase
METVSQVVETYGRELVVVRGVRPATVLAYSKGVQCFLRWLDGRSIYEVKREDFLRWREEEAPKRKPSGMQLVVSAVRSFYAWLLETQRIPANPCPALVIRKTHEDPRVPTSAQFLQIRAAVQHYPQRSALIEVLVGSGLRIDAALSLRHDQVLLSNGVESPDWRRQRQESGETFAEAPTRPTDYIRMDAEHSKSRRAVMIPITPCAARALRRWMKPEAKSEDRVFQCCYGSAYRYVRDAGASIGVDLSPHSLRHLYACLMYHRNLDAQSHDPVWVRDAMCHSSVAMTDRYMRMARYVVLNEFDWHEIVWHWVPGVAKATAAGAAS